jgi:hypothetical protein
LKQFQQSHYLFNLIYRFSLKALNIFLLITISYSSYAADQKSQETSLSKKKQTSDITELESNDQNLETKAKETQVEINAQEAPVIIEIEQEKSKDPQKKPAQSSSGSFYEDFKRQQEETLKQTQLAADESQVNVSRRLHKFSSYVDKFFAEENYVQESYESRLRFSLSNQYQKYATPTLKPRINLSLALPNTKNRWRLQFQSNDDENEEANSGSNSTNKNNSNNDVKDNSFTTALGITLKKSKLVDIRTNIGVKFDTPLDPFARLRLRRSLVLKNTELRLTETFEWLDSIGKNATTQFEIEYPISKNYFFRSKSNATYWDIDSYWSAAQSFTLYDQLSPVSLIAYAVGISAQNEDDLHIRKKDQVNNYWIETRYRKMFYKDWLFYQISPGLVHPREYEFETLPRIELKLEAVYGHLIK